MSTIVFYAVDISDLQSWVGRGDRRALEAAQAALREDEEADWEPAEWELLDRLLERMVIQGKLYEDLNEEERYYLTQILIDLFDEFVDSEAVSEDFPLEAIEEALAPLLRAGGEPGRLAAYLLRGRRLSSLRGPGSGTTQARQPAAPEETLRRPGQPADEALPYLGWALAAELPVLEEALAQPRRELRGRSAAAWKAVAAACRTCREAEQDLLAFVG